MAIVTDDIRANVRLTTRVVETGVAVTPGIVLVASLCHQFKECPPQDRVAREEKNKREKLRHYNGQGLSEQPLRWQHICRKYMKLSSGDETNIPVDSYHFGT